MSLCLSGDRNVTNRPRKYKAYISSWVNFFRCAIKKPQKAPCFHGVFCSKEGAEGRKSITSPQGCQPVRSRNKFHVKRFKACSASPMSQILSAHLLHQKMPSAKKSAPNPARRKLQPSIPANLASLAVPQSSPTFCALTPSATFCAPFLPPARRPGRRSLVPPFPARERPKCQAARA